MDISEAMDIGDVGGVSNDDNDGDLCNLKSRGSGPERYIILSE